MNCDTSKKTGFAERSLELLTRLLFKRSRIECIASGICVTCGNDAKWFRDDESANEYMIGGMCQECQDSIFGVRL